MSTLTNIEQVLIIDPGMFCLIGHHQVWNSFLQKSFDAQGLKNSLVVAKSLPPLPEELYHDVIRHFNFNPRPITNAGHPELDSETRYKSQAMLFATELSQLNNQISEKTLVFCHSLSTSATLAGMVEWYKTLPPSRRPYLAINSSFLFCNPQGQEAERLAEAALLLSNWPKTRFFSQLDTIIDHFEAVRPGLVQPLPWPLDLGMPFEENRHPGSMENDLVFGFAGTPIAKKNIAILPEAINDYLETGGRGRFLVQLAPPFASLNDTERLKAFAQKYPKRLELILERLDPDTTYYSFLRRFNVFLALYDPEVFHLCRSSQVFMEVAWLGRPAIIPRGGWLEKEAEALDNGCLIMDELSGPGLALALKEFETTATKRLAKAEAAGREIRAKNNPDTFWRILLDEITSTNKKAVDYSIEQATASPPRSLNMIQKKAVILGNGPSLKGFNFANELHDYAAFGMNAAYRHWDRINWYPDFYSCLDLRLGLSHKDDIRRLIQCSDEYGIKGFLLRDNLINSLGVIGNHPKVANYDQIKLFTPLLSFKRVTTGSHTLAWAAALGYTDIILLGMDADYVNFLDGVKALDGIGLELTKTPETNPNYFFDDYQREGDVYCIPNPNPKDAVHIAAWQPLKEPLENCGVCVVNANPASKIDTFTKCLFKDAATILEKEREKIPQIKELNELGQLKKELEAKRFIDLDQQRKDLETKRFTDLSQQKKELEIKHQTDLAKQKSELEARPIFVIIMMRYRQAWNHILSKYRLRKRIQKEYTTLTRSDMFDANYYLNNNPDVAKSGMDPLLHFIQFGWKEKRNPGVQFDVVAYLTTYPDVQASGINPLVHYIKYGKTEGRTLPLPRPTGKEKPSLAANPSAPDHKEQMEAPKFKFTPWPTENTTDEKFMLFSEEIIENRPDLALEVLGFSSKFNRSLGWHYLLDLVWVLAHLSPKPPARILDAGGGNGLLQFILAAYGHQVVSADAFLRTPPANIGNLIKIKKSGSQEAIKTAYAVHHDQAGNKTNEQLPTRASISPGEIEYHCCNLEHLEHLETGEFDAVVSVSALEHNSPEKLPTIMAELRRVAKPKAPLLITISVDSSARFDEPSHSWLLNQSGVAKAYDLAAGYTTNFSEIEAIRDSLKNSKYLARWLAAFYYSSDKNGMPWGYWNPTYLPAGLLLSNKKPKSK